MREGEDLVLPTPKRRRMGGVSRKRSLAQAAGTEDFMDGARPGRMWAVRRRREVPTRGEEGRDDSGVT